jgi:hypothetical protein
MNPEIEEILKREWPSTQRQLQPPPRPLSAGPPQFKDCVFWSRHLTPGFPAQWPPSPGREWIFYAFAYGSQPSVLVDGVWVTVPWARFVVTPDDLVRFERLAQAPRILAGSQGMRPLRPEEELLFRQSNAVFEEFADALRKKSEISPGPLVEKVRRSYRFWAGCNGVVAREIRRLHASFFEWLDLPQTGCAENAVT